jgi:hypothetical protein
LIEKIETKEDHQHFLTGYETVDDALGDLSNSFDIDVRVPFWQIYLPENLTIHYDETLGVSGGTSGWRTTKNFVVKEHHEICSDDGTAEEEEGQEDTASSINKVQMKQLEDLAKTDAENLKPLLKLMHEYLEDWEAVSSYNSNADSEERKRISNIKKKYEKKPRPPSKTWPKKYENLAVAGNLAMKTRAYGIVCLKRNGVIVEEEKGSKKITVL